MSMFLSAIAGAAFPLAAIQDPSWIFLTIVSGSLACVAKLHDE